MNNNAISNPVHSSDTGYNQRPHVAHVYTNHNSSGLTAGCVFPPVNSIHKSTSATARRASKRRMSPIPVPRRRVCRCGVYGRRLRHRDCSTRCSGANIHDTESFEGARSELNADTSVELLRRCDSMAHADCSRTSFSSESALEYIRSSTRATQPWQGRRRRNINADGVVTAEFIPASTRLHVNLGRRRSQDSAQPAPPQ